jgi:rhodanese-related sulfurtransferase
MIENIIIDVRTPQEFAEGHIEQSVNIPLDRITGRTGELRRYKKITVVCLSGKRSNEAKKLLETSGFTNVYDGGSWESLYDFNKK